MYSNVIIPFSRAVVCRAPRLKPRALLMAGPPCSLFVGASSSVHMRRQWRLLGNVWNRKVRLANLIWANFVPRIDLLDVEWISMMSREII